jgi:phosphate transport system permease protein
MRLSTRHILDKAFTGTGLLSIALMVAAILVILIPIFLRGVGSFWFVGTVEHRQLLMDRFGRGNEQSLAREVEKATEARQVALDMIEGFKQEMREWPRRERKPYRAPLRETEELLRELLGPLPGEPTPVLVRNQYGQTRWDRALVRLDQLLYIEEWDYSDSSEMGQLVLKPRVEQFAGTSLEPLFGYVEENLEAMLLPSRTLYWQFFIDESFDAHFFGGIWSEILGTLYLTVGAMLFAVPMGVIAAIYLCEYAKEGRVIGFLRTCINTLAGVPSIVFGLFGLAFFINSIHVSPSKSVLAGSLTLSLLVLPTIIRASEEAILAVPRAYKEAALSLGSTSWHTVLTVILPAALPGILTGIVISMGRAAGETAPIIFTAAVSVGAPLNIMETLTEPTMALPWNIYNLATEHEAVDEIRHVQYGMVLTLVGMVLMLNMAAIILRARISKKLKG